jgi:heme/copper-type cytochrome/quinol oxidase subunit 1
VRRLRLPQRIVIIVGLAVALWFVGRYIVAGRSGSFGWVAYAPLSHATDGPNFGGMAPWAAAGVAGTHGGVGSGLGVHPPPSQRTHRRLTQHGNGLS